eukprot:158464_1
MKIWKCKCGEFQVHLEGRPIVSHNCWCHSCTGTCLYINETKGGTSGLSHPKGGCATSTYRICDIHFKTKNPSDKLAYTRIGDAPSHFAMSSIWCVRSYTKCCGTYCMTGGAQFPFAACQINRNCIYNNDGTTKWEPDEPIINLCVQYAFDPSSVPEPKHEGAPLWYAGRLAPHGVKDLLGLGYGNHPKDEPAIKKSPKDNDLEVIPIKW